MKRPMIIGNEGNPWESLANAIIVQATRDYRVAIKLQNGSITAERTVKECEMFFRSQYFTILSAMNPEYLIDRIRQEEKKDG